MLLDGHIHVGSGEGAPEDFHNALAQAGVDGGVVLSLPPESFPHVARPRPFAERLEDVFRWTEGNGRLYPFFWIDPLEDDALEQVGRAVERGVAGFKVICNRFFAREERPMQVFRAVAAQGRPILFHSGILYDGNPSSSRYNRPVEFADLMGIEGLRFSLAHISWPWCDEAIALFGEFLSTRAKRPELGSELFIDTTRGTPGVYRREAFSKLFGVGYDVSRNVFYGSDGRANPYRSESIAQRAAEDRQIMSELGVDESVQDAVFAGNLLRFVEGEAEQRRGLPGANERSAS